MLKINLLIIFNNYNTFIIRSIIKIQQVICLNTIIYNIGIRGQSYAQRNLELYIVPPILSTDYLYILPLLFQAVAFTFQTYFCGLNQYQVNIEALPCAFSLIVTLTIYFLTLFCFYACASLCRAFNCILKGLL